jgi:tape measure domain-containing protein
MSFDIPIKVDPGDSAAKIKGVETALKQAEDKGKAAGAAMATVGKAFRSLGDAVKQQQSAFERSKQLHDQLTRQANPLAQGFARVADAIKRERDMLAALHGPAQQAFQDIQTLTSLLNKGAISAGEFNAKLHAIRAPGRLAQGGARGGFDAASALGGLPGGSLIAGAVGGGVGGAATAGVQMAIGAAGQVIELADAYQGLQNRLKQLTGSQEQASALFEKLHRSANKTYSDVNTTTQSFITFSRALKGLGVSQDQTIAFTERLNQVIAMSGTSGAGAQAAMLQLGQALSSGVLRGEEFNSIIEQAPALLDPIAKHLGVTVGQLRGLAQQGKITSKVIFDSFEEAGPSIDRAFGDAVPTIGQQFQKLKNDIGVTVGEMAQSVGASKAAGEAFKNLGSIIGVVAEQTKFVVGNFDKLGGAIGVNLGDLTKGSLSSVKEIEKVFSGDFASKLKNAGQEMADAQQVINRTIAEGTGKLDEYAQAQTEATLKTQLGSEAATAFRQVIDTATGKTDTWRSSTEGVSAQIGGLTKNLSDAVAAVANWDGALDQLLRKMDPWYDAHERTVSGLGDITTEMLRLGHLAPGVWDKMSDKMRSNAAEANKLRDEYAKLGRALLGSETPADRAIRAGAADRAGFQARIEAESQAEIDAEKRAYDSHVAFTEAQIKVDDDWRKAVIKSTDEAAEKRIKAEDEAREKSEENSQRMKEAWAGTAGSIAADLANAFADGEVSADKLLRKAALLALQVAASQMGGSGGSFLSALAGGLGGGANGFDYLSSGRGLQLPGFATGGDMIMRGSGGTDSQLAMWWMTPGESLHVRTPEQRREAAEESGGGGRRASRGRTQVVVQMQNDRRDLVRQFDSRDGEQVIANIDRRTRRGQRR